ncbi:sodium:proton antiporter [Halomonas sp. McH1-25]|uniref:cation:proton antiporter n=1 Tax=unclassified Halomonas TaxID=2609666 RepID=UPI001EF69D75|nr:MULTISPECIES: sodium:proton antiporter [unclassified Halomonas]MCG7599986.1 sodium:proton antiporter [Halomonas sp. McH1-25]MCP1343397.1 sodium:proton antiporter [Halomonas sp. FL8]MCP1360446.1 sodium:proton antiporter [Halomonas sp. BBD45]MCP1363794.1 sodium:proton antiporter [Halomonas sp. BBD48]
MLELIAIIVSLTAILAWFNHQFVRLPTTIGVMAIALAFSWGLHGLAWLGFTAIEDQAEVLLSRIDFNQLLMDGMLSLLLFAGALHIDLDRLRRYRWSIGFLATLGVVISTLAIGSAAYFLLGTLGLAVPWMYCLVFGALISPTDPIAVLGILRNANAPVDLELRIVGESLFNDGVAVVVFTLLLGAAAGDEALTVMHAGKLFLQEAGGGILLGLVIGTLAYWLMRSIDEYRIEVLISLAVVLGGYSLALHLHISGPIAMVVAGLLIGNKARQSAMSDTTREHLDAFWELIDEILNTLLFVLIGLEVLLIPFELAHLWACAGLIVVILAVRFTTIGVPVMLLREQLGFRRGSARILTWGGLRGGISVALALALPDGETRDILLTVTYLIVLFSILVQGLSIGRVVTWLLGDSRHADVER